MTPHSNVSITARAVGAVVGIIFFVAGITKAISPEPAIRLITWLIPAEGLWPSLPFGLLLFVVGWEIALGLSLIFFPQRRSVSGAAGITLLLLSVVLIRLTMAVGAPPCACFGPWGGTQASDHFIGLFRNAMLGVVVVILLVEPSLSASRMTNPASTRGVRAFSIIEMLVVIIVVATLLAILLPLLAKSRSSARDARTVAELRQCVGMIAAYQNDARDTFPYFHTPGQPRTPARFGEIELTRFSYFSAGRVFWPNVLNDRDRLAIAPIVSKFSAKRQLDNIEDGLPADMIRSRLSLSFTVFADPAYFTGDVPPSDPLYFRATRGDEVLFPASKGIIVDFAFRRQSSGNTTTLQAGIALADGSARWIDWKWDDSAVVWRPHGVQAVPWLVLATRDGLRGRDILP